MIVIADTNIFYSVLISPTGEIANILNEKEKIQFFIPEYLVEELYEHLPNIQAYLQKKNIKKTKKQLISEIRDILRGIIVIPIKDVLRKHVEKAREIVEDIDPDDYPFIPLHLQIKHKIWSGDETLKKGLTAKGYGHFLSPLPNSKRNFTKGKLNPLTFPCPPKKNLSKLF